MSISNNSAIIDRIKSRSKEKGYSLTFLYKTLNLPSGYLRDVHAGKSSFTDERLNSIANFLGTTVEWLLGKTDIKEKPAPISENELSDSEREIIDIWRSFSPEEQERVLKILSALQE